jgi:uncharacterized protein YidB (DUF937 family)
MGLLDVLNGMQNGPHGQPQPSAPGSGGMSKTTMALLAFLAYKAFKGMHQPQAQAGVPSPNRGGQDREQQEPGGLAGVLRTIFGGGSVPGPVLSRGVGNTVQDLERSGHGEIARSWVGRGPNRPISPEKLEAALGEDGIKDLMQQTGMERDDLLAMLSEHLPRVIDHLTPEGRLPTEQEASRLA